MILTQGGLTQPNNPVSVNPNYPPTAAYRRPGLEFIRTVKISEQDYSTAIGTPAWRANRVDIDLEGAPFSRYKEVLFSFNGGFSSSAAVEANIYLRKQGALASSGAGGGNFAYSIKDITAATPTVSYTATTTASGVMPVTVNLGTTNAVQTLDVYVSPMGLRGETHMTADTTYPTTSMMRFNMRFPAAVSPDNFTSYFFDNESPGLSLYVGNGTTQFMRAPYYTSLSGYAQITNFECNIYGFVR